MSRNTGRIETGLGSLDPSRPQPSSAPMGSQRRRVAVEWHPNLCAPRPGTKPAIIWLPSSSNWELGAGNLDSRGLGACECRHQARILIATTVAAGGRHVYGQICTLYTSCPSPSRTHNSRRSWPIQPNPSVLGPRGHGAPGDMVTPCTASIPRCSRR